MVNLPMFASQIVDNGYGQYGATGDALEKLQGWILFERHQ